MCRGTLAWGTASIRCSGCVTDFEVSSGIPVLLPEDVSDSHKQMQADFFDRAETEFEITRPHGTTALYQWLISEKFRRSVSALRSLVANGTALTVCGGSGMEAEFLSRCGSQVGLADISPGAVQRARARARRFGFALTGVVADAEQLPFADRSVDVVYVHDGLHHLERPFAALAEMMRVARWAVSVNEPAQAAVTRLAVRIQLSETEEEAGNVIRRLDPDVVVRHLEQADFRVVRAERYAMVYRHEPGTASRLFSARPVFPLVRGTHRVFNAISAGIGNKFTVQAVRG